MNHPVLTLRPLTPGDLPGIVAWFEDPGTHRFLGGADWPAAMLANADRSGGTTFRGAIQTGAHHYLALVADNPVGYIDCGTFDRCTVYGGEAPDGPLIIESVDVATGSIAFLIDPQVRRRGLGRVMVAALAEQPELHLVELFEAGVEPANTAARRCLAAAGFSVQSDEPDCEGMLYYRAWRARVDLHATLLA